MVFLLPVDDRLIVFVTGQKITESRMFDTFLHGLLNRRNNREVHIGDPHRNDVEAFFPFKAGEAEFLFGRTVDRNGVMAAAVHDRCKIKLCHCFISPSNI